jgi:hypothetical protein
LAEVVEALLGDPARLASMAAASAKTGIVDAAERLAELVCAATGRIEASSSFSEEKEPKRLLFFWLRTVSRLRPKLIKVFLLLFLQKKKAFLSL